MEGVCLSLLLKMLVSGWLTLNLDGIISGLYKFALRVIPLPELQKEAS